VRFASLTRRLKLVRCPRSLASTLVTLPSMSLIPFAPLKLGVTHTSSLLPSQLYLDHSHCLVLAPAILAALPSTRAIPDRGVFYVTHPIDSFAPAPSPSRVCPSMSRLPSTPHSLHLSDGNDGCGFDERRLGLVGDRLGQKR